MKKRRFFKAVGMSSMALAMLLSGVTGTMMSNPITIKAAMKDSSNTPNGVANLGGGSASITIGQNGHSLMGKQFQVYKLFDAENATDMESINYTFNDEYKAALQKVVGERISKNADDVTEYEVIDYIQTLNSNPVEGADADQTLEGRYSDFRYFVEELRTTMVEMNMTGSQVTVTGELPTGGIRIDGLDYGYYIVDEVTNTEGDHDAASLCMVNTANPDAEVTIKSDYPSVIKKIDEDDNDIGWNDIGDYEIGQTVPYKYETHVPDMNGYHTYYFAFHGKMDEALTFHKDSVQITIEGANSKSYTLKNTEFNVIEGGEGETFKVEISDLKAIVDREFPEGLNNNNENTYGQAITLTYNATLNDKAAEDTGRPGFENAVKLEFSNDPDSDGTGETGETFKVEISDLKAIVDREFPEGLNNNNENTYGQAITLTYNATLNDKAAEDTGRPGFENAVKLEFSNDPDSDGTGETGETPWDTVVCFTYKINGTKINNHDKLLADAHFRLYSDEECTQEVYVKKTEAGYNVINRDSLGGTDHTGGSQPAEAVEMVSDENGVFTIFGLDQGTYWLKETDSPDGYRELLDPIEITITPTFTNDRQNYVAGDGATDKTLQKLEATAHVKEFLDGLWGEEDKNLTTDIEDGAVNITVVNTVGKKLPITGSNLTLLMLAGGIAIMAGSYIYLVKRKKGANADSTK